MIRKVFIVGLVFELLLISLTLYTYYSMKCECDKGIGDSSCADDHKEHEEEDIVTILETDIMIVNDIISDSTQTYEDFYEAVDSLRGKIEEDANLESLYEDVGAQVQLWDRISDVYEQYEILLHYGEVSQGGKMLETVEDFLETNKKYNELRDRMKEEVAELRGSYQDLKDYEQRLGEINSNIDRRRTMRIELEDRKGEMMDKYDTKKLAQDTMKRSIDLTNLTFHTLSADFLLAAVDRTCQTISSEHQHNPPIFDEMKRRIKEKEDELERNVEFDFLVLGEQLIRIISMENDMRSEVHDIFGSFNRFYETNFGVGGTGYIPHYDDDAGLEYVSNVLYTAYEWICALESDLFWSKLELEVAESADPLSCKNTNEKDAGESYEKARLELVDAERSYIKSKCEDFRTTQELEQLELQISKLEDQLSSISHTMREEEIEKRVLESKRMSPLLVDRIQMLDENLEQMMKDHNELERRLEVLYNRVELDEEAYDMGRGEVVWLTKVLDQLLEEADAYNNKNDGGIYKE